MPIRKRLVLIILVANVLGLLLACAGFIAVELQRQRELIETRLDTLAAVVGSNSAAALLFDDAAQAEKTLNAFNADEHIIAAALYDVEGRRFATYGRPGLGNDVPLLPVRLPSPSAGPVYGEGEVMIRRPVLLDNELVGTLLLKSDLGEIVQRVVQYAQIVLVVLALSGAVAVTVGAWLQRAITLPLGRLTDAVKGFGEGRSTAPIPASDEDEIGVLARAYNVMVENLQRTTVSKNYVDEVFRSMFDMLIVVTPDGVIETVNQAACTLLGYPEDELVGRRFATVLDTAVVPAAGGPEERVYVARDGRRIPVSFTSAAMGDGSGIHGFVCVAQDITARKQQEEVIRGQQTQLASVSRMSALGEMAAGVAHEINNPLAIIHGRAGQLRILARRDQLDRDAVLEVAGKIEDTVMRCTRIVSGMRLFSRDGQQEPFRAVGIIAIVQDTLELCRERFHYHQVNLVIHVPPEEAILECRAPQIGQVLLNLLNNAFDAVAAVPVANGGPVASAGPVANGETEKKVTLEVQADADRIFLRVSNSGPPVPDELQERIFEPFFSTKGVGRGTGLGLSISKGIVEAHQGVLVLEKRDQPVTFAVSLPRYQSPSPVGRRA